MMTRYPKGSSERNATRSGSVRPTRSTSGQTPRVATPKVSSTERRAQIAATALEFLAHTSISALTTRGLAAELGLTQPALFRHFRNRDELLLGVVEHARAELGRTASGVLAQGGSPLALIQALGELLMRNAEASPGLPRLVFASANEATGELKEALRGVITMQRGLLSELIRQGQDAGELAPELDPATAVTLFVGMVQGLILRWELDDRRESLVRCFAPHFALWRRAVTAPSNTPDARLPDTPETPSARFATIDARPLLARGVDPLEDILTRIASVRPGGVAFVATPFLPRPLIQLLERRGHVVASERLAPDHFWLEVFVAARAASAGDDLASTDAPVIEDLRELAPPGPLERVLEVVESLPPGGRYLARVPRIPHRLLPLLRRPGLDFEVAARPDGAALIMIERAPS